MSLGGFILNYNSCVADMSLIAPAAKLADDRTRKRPSHPIHPALSTFSCQLQPAGVPLLNSRHPACAGQKSFSHPPSLVVLPDTAMQKSQMHGNSQGEGQGRKHHGLLWSRCGSEWAAPAPDEQHLLGEEFLINDNWFFFFDWQTSSLPVSEP